MACYRKQGCKCIEGSDEKHEGWEACREANTTWAREHRRKTHPERGSANAQRRTTRILDEDELMKLRKQVGLI